MNSTRPCPSPDSCCNPSPGLRPDNASGLFRWALSATAMAALAACGGGGGGAVSGEPANEAPSVAIDAPLANATFDAGAPIRITATATDRDGTVVRVEFFNGTTKIGEDTTAPFELVWTDAPAGSHNVTARAFDNAGAAAISGSRPLSVTATPPSPPPPSPPPPSPPAPPPPPPPPPNQPPTVAITSPANNFKPNAPAALGLAANAADPDGGISKVEFYRVNPAAPVFNASTLVGQASAVGTPPVYQLLTPPLTAGTYSFIARATDNSGDTATSSSVQVIVNALPTVTISAPAANATIQLGSTVTLRAIASDADGGINKVEFFLDGSAIPLGQAVRVGTTNEYTLPWTNVTLGAHTLTARATDNDGAVQSTATVPVNVPANVAPTISLDNPVAGTNAPTTLTLAATATDSDGTITSVEFFNGAVSLGLGTRDAVPSNTWRRSVPIGAAQPGTYTITARATDNLGGTTTTASKPVTIAPNVPPAVTMNLPASFNLPAAVVITATASDSDGIAKVEFFNGATKLGEDLTAPYEFTWNGVAAGSYSITARATDIHGNTATSPAQAVVVNPDPVGMWSTLNDTQKAGFTMLPNKLVEAGGVDAVEVLTAIGANTVIPSFSGALAQAARALADLTPVIPATPAGQTSVSVSCPGGGTLQVALPLGASLASPDRIFNYDNCVIGGFTFYGGAGMPPYIQLDSTTVRPPGSPNPFPVSINSTVDYTQLSPTSFRLLFQALRVNGNGAPDPGGKDWPRNALPYSTVTCTVAGAAKRCLTNLAVTFLWGSDLSWSGYSDNGTVPPAANYATDDRYVLSGMQRSHYCSPDPDLPNNGRDACLANPPPARHIRFEGMTNNSGRAIVYGTNGYSVVTRLAPASPGVERLRVVRTITTATTINGVVYPVGTAPPETFQCTVGATTGDWACTMIP